ncbi:GGDEF domain-containing protein [Ferribacterium limneticum]|uniref:GGDEF domain-containing protein n=1 Tax=Ferribacterium limneticum TaxID=76259 RepID=UPI001CF9D7F7|nr:GGDEF domain-containing protein [Ferribacterium limneticum]UCV27629.1 diguanylate cyclase [Ferribacterium limneticum]UCV31546.1 diguanylate cyclase [Ferribacterium limneticum]
MTTLTNPFEIARETLRLLATRRIPPSPDNYLTLYHEIAGTKPAGNSFPESQLRSLAAALPKVSPDQLRLARQLDEAVKAANWEDYKKCLTDFISALAESQKLSWSELITDLLRQWDAKHPGLTAARKRESLEHVLTNSGANPDTLFNRLQSLLRSWGHGKEIEAAPTAEANASETTPVTASPAAASDLLPELRELFAFTLETAIATQLLESPQLSSDAKVLANDIRTAVSPAQLQEFLTRLKRFAFKLELLAEDQAELRHSLLNLLRLLVGNITELVLDDHWLHGQIAVVREIIDKPLSQRALDDAESRLKEVLFKQAQLKASLSEARDAIKHMLAGFVDHLADFAEATSDYHDKIESCAEKISSANDISELETVLGEVMRETRTIQINAQRSRDELQSTRQKVQESEARIQELERELETTSDLVRHDQLTGVLNRRGLEETFAKEAARATRHDATLCVALIDIDNFKKLNDSMGHDTGDEALIHLATICRETLRPQDTVARYGGEEFIILLPETSLDDGVVALTRLQRELTKKFFLHANEKVLITFSAGVTQMRPTDNQASLIKRADEAMYEAKRSGKNRVLTS